MKKLVIVSHNLEIGGIQKSLVNFINRIEGIYEIDLLLFDPSGPYLKDLVSNVNILPSSDSLKLLTKSVSESRSMGIKWYIIKIILSLWSRLFSNRIPFKLLMNTYEMNREYDIAISFVHSNSHKKMYYGCNEFVINKVRSHRKISFIHCDVSKHDGTTETNMKYYRKFDKIISVSNSVKKQVDCYFKLDNVKLDVLYNFFDKSEILDKSREYPVFIIEDKINLVFVGRLSDEKGILTLISALSQLETKNRIHLTVVGDGPLKTKINEFITNLTLNENISLIGSKSNPYPYILEADALVLPSQHEAAPMVYGESIILGTPILTTKTLSSVELVEDLQAGVVCDNSEEGIKNMLKKIVADPNILSDKKNSYFAQNSKYIMGATNNEIKEVLEGE